MKIPTQKHSCKCTELSL